jgi:hypothetical protein
MSEHERWAEAAAILKWQGDNARLYVAERIGALAREGSEAGVARFKDLAVKLDALLSGPMQ